MTVTGKTGAATYSSAISDADNYTRWIIDLMLPYIGAAVLEVGLGHGGYREHLPRGIRYTGVDLDAEAVCAASAKHPGDCCFVADIADREFPTRVKDHSAAPDTVICANVLEHVEDDEAAVTNMLNVLEPGGRLLLYVPAHGQLFGTMDRLAGHHRRYSKKDLPRIAGAHTVTTWSYVNPIGALGWWLNRNVGYDSLDSAAINRQIRWFDRYVLPVSRNVTPLTRHLFGQSLFCVLEPA